jgi:GNAT superfamily N-acetyltransferase
VAAARWRVEPLARHHDKTGFTCGVAALDDYLQRQAGQDQQRKVAACYVAVDPSVPAGTPAPVRGYYTLSNYGMRLVELPADVTRRLPGYPLVPAALLGRLAVAREFQGAGLGEHLLMDALERTQRLANEIAIHAIVVDAIDPAAADYYERYEFRRLPSEPLRLFLLLTTVARLSARKRAAKSA